MESLKFVMISVCFPPYNIGGIGTHVMHLSNELARMGHEIHVIQPVDAFRLPHIKRKEIFFPKLEAQVSVHRLSATIGPLDPILGFILGRSMLCSRIDSLINKIGPDVVHYHNISLLGPSIVKPRRTRLNIYTAHDYWLLCPKSTLFNYVSNDNCDRRNCLVCSFLSRRPPQLWRYFQGVGKAIDLVDVIISPSLFIKKMLVGSGFRNEIEVVPNFVPNPDTYRTMRRSDRFFLFVGRLCYEKGVTVLVDQYLKTGSDLELLLVGAGPLRRKLESVLTRRRNRNIKLMGFLRDDQVSELYANASATIVPSLWYEPFGLVAIESMARGTPIIVNDVGGLSEIVDRSNAGKKIRIGVDGELGEAMDLLDGSASETYRRRAFESYEAFFSPRPYMMRYFSVLRR